MLAVTATADGYTSESTLLNLREGEAVRCEFTLDPKKKVSTGVVTSRTYGNRHVPHHHYVDTGIDAESQKSVDTDDL